MATESLAKSFAAMEVSKNIIANDRETLSQICRLQELASIESDIDRQNSTQTILSIQILKCRLRVLLQSWKCTF